MLKTHPDESHALIKCVCCGEIKLVEIIPRTCSPECKRKVRIQYFKAYQRVRIAKPQHKEQVRARAAKYRTTEKYARQAQARSKDASARARASHKPPTDL